MKKNFLTLTFLAAAFVAVQAQTLAPAAVTSAATKMTQSNGSLSFTVGELVVQTQTDANGNTLGGGFTNSATGSTTVTVVQTPDMETMTVNVYPNPTTDLLTVHVAHSTVDTYLLQLTDMQGRLVHTSHHAGISGRVGVNMTTYPAGTYLLTLLGTDGRAMGSYRIVRQ
jgi:hypothetical protein